MASPVLTLLEDIGRSHERIARLSGQLDWDGVNSEWQLTYRKLLELKSFSLDELPDSEKTKVAQQIERVLELEQQISEQIAPWLEQVRPLLESFSEHPIAPEHSEAE